MATTKAAVVSEQDFDRETDSRMRRAEAITAVLCRWSATDVQGRKPLELVATDFQWASAYRESLDVLPTSEMKAKVPSASTKTIVRHIVQMVESGLVAFPVVLQ